MTIHKSAEDYLETILRLREQKGSVRSVDVAEEMGFSKPSVSVAMKKLRESGHVTVDETGHLALTEEGEAVATQIYQRHRVLKQLLTDFGVDEETAAEEACQIEHVISEATMEKIRKAMDMNKESPSEF